MPTQLQGKNASSVLIQEYLRHTVAAVRCRAGSKLEGMRILLASILALGLLSAAEIKLGKPLAVSEPLPLATLLAHADDYVGKTVQVKGKAVEVCEMMGCWIDLTNEAGQKLRIKVNDGEIVFPKDSPGRDGDVAEAGRFTKERTEQGRGDRQGQGRGGREGREVRSGLGQGTHDGVPDSGVGRGNSRELRGLVQRRAAVLRA